MPMDPTTYTARSRELWNASADDWVTWGPTFHAWVGAATDAMLDAARVTPGQRVLDLATGDGEQAFVAARRVGEGGRVVATDFAPRLVEQAARRAKEQGLSNVETRVADAEQLEEPPGSYDAVVCRFGLMLFGRPGVALQNARRVLREGGRVAVVVPSSPEKNPWMALTMATIGRRAGAAPPAPGEPGFFRYAAEGGLAQEMRDAGFREIEVQRLPLALRAKDTASFAAFMRGSVPILKPLLASMSEEERGQTWREVEAALSRFTREGAFEAPAEMLVAGATK